VTIPSPSHPLGWRKSSYSAEGACFEVAPLPDGNIAIRNSNRPSLGVTIFTRHEMAAFLQGAKAGEFDDMT
jgi:hypothetical protein